MGEERYASLFRNGRNQAVRIPVEFEMPGKRVLMRKEGDRLIIEPAEQKSSLAEWLATLEPWDEEFPDVDEGLLPARDIEL